MNYTEALFAAVLALITPLIGGLLVGVDRKLTARMQERVGPPLAQPFYDVLKLWGKTPMIASKLQPVLAFGYLGFALVAAGGLVSVIYVFRLPEPRHAPGVP